MNPGAPGLSAIPGAANGAQDAAVAGSQSTRAGVAGFLTAISPGLLLLLGAVALVGSGPFLDTLRSTQL